MKKQVLKNSFTQIAIKLLLLIFLSCLFFYSCNSGDKNHKLIPAGNMVDLLTEFYVANGLLAFPPVRILFSMKDSTSNYIDIIKRHGYTKERVDNTLRYYFENNPKKLENIYDQVLTRLSERQALLEKETPPVAEPPKNLWTGSATVNVPETGINDPVWFSIPVKDTGNYVLGFSTIVFNDDQTFNPKVTVFFWHADTSKDGFKVYWGGVPLPKDGQWHNYTLEKRNSDTTITHINGWLIDHDPQDGRWIKHARIENISLKKAPIQ